MISLQSPARRRIYLILLLVASLCLTLAAVIAPLMQSSLSPVPKQGEIALRDYRAPQAISFNSEVLTQQRRDTVERTILPIYTSPDTRIARRQLEQLRATLAYINSVRADSYASSDQKMTDLAALDDIHLRQDTILSILGLADARWQEVQQEAIVVLERVMSSAIRPQALSEARNRVPALVTLSLPEEQAAVVADLVMAYVAPNSQFSESLTQAALEEARRTVEPVMRTFVPGQTIVLQGEVLGADDIEALQQLGLMSSERNIRDLVSAVILSLLMVVFMTFYLRRKQILYGGDVRNLAMAAMLFLFFLVSARLVIPTNMLMPYAFPLASFRVGDRRLIRHRAGVGRLSTVGDPGDLRVSELAGIDLILFDQQSVWRAGIGARPPFEHFLVGWSGCGDLGRQRGLGLSFALAGNEPGKPGYADSGGFLQWSGFDQHLDLAAFAAGAVLGDGHPDPIAGFDPSGPPLAAPVVARCRRYLPAQLAGGEPGRTGG